MFKDLLVNEDSIKIQIQSVLEKVAKEINSDHKGLFVMIKPKNENFDFHLALYKVDESTTPQPPKFVRNMKLSEILKP